jgi:chaperonin cofactor prefoldin
MEKEVSKEVQDLILQIQDQQNQLKILDNTLETLEMRLNSLNEQRSKLFSEYENNKGMLNHLLYSGKVSTKRSK